MADSKTSALTEATEITDADEFYVNDSSTSKRIAKPNLMDQTGGIWHPSDGAVGDSHASFDNTDATKYRPLMSVVYEDQDNTITANGYVTGGIVYIRQVTDADSMAYRIHTPKSSGDANFCIYDLSDDGFPTGAPVWSQALVDPATGGATTDTGLTAFSIDAGWYFFGVWNWGDGGGSLAMRSVYSFHTGPIYTSNIATSRSINYYHNTNGAPATLNGTETWLVSPTSPAAVYVLDSTS